MKLLGAMMILSGSGAICLRTLSAQRRELQTLREMAAALELLSHSVRTSLLPLPRLMERRGQGPFADAFFARVLKTRESGAALGQCWREAAETLPLRLRERETLARAAEAFGQTEEGVVAVLLDCAQALRAAHGARESEQLQDRRVTQTLCFGGGALLVIVLL